MVVSRAYLDMKFDDPNIFRRTYVGKSALVIGTGMSTQRLVKHKNQIRDKFDAVIGLNFATIDFENQLTHNLILEKNPVKSYDHMKKHPELYRKDLPRILNFKGLHRFPQDLNIIKATRSTFEGRIDITKYSFNNCKGFLNGPCDKQGLALGSVGLHGIHLGCILGCSKIYTIGLDMIFGEEYDHYYQDRYYRDNRKEIHKSPIIEVEYNGKTYETSRYFRDSAGYIDWVVDNLCRPKGIEVYGFNDGLLKSPIQLDIDEFFQEE